jgi:hypothetical protein
MAYREYILDDGSSLLIEVPDPEPTGGVVRAARGGEKSLPEKIGEALKFDQALASAKKSVLAMQAAFEEAKADEVEVKFGLKATGELGGSFMVAKGGIEANYEVTLKWKKVPRPPEVKEKLAAAQKK